MILVDTGVWYSLLVTKDRNHSHSTEWFESLNEPVATTDYIVDETLTLLLVRGEKSKAIEFGNLVIVGSTVVFHKISEDQFNRSWILFHQLLGAGLSFTDCTSHIVARDLNISTVASFDHHFRSTGKFMIVP